MRLAGRAEPVSKVTDQRGRSKAEGGSVDALFRFFRFAVDSLRLRSSLHPPYVRSMGSPEELDELEKANDLEEAEDLDDAQDARIAARPRRRRLLQAHPLQRTYQTLTCFFLCSCLDFSCMLRLVLSTRSPQHGAIKGIAPYFDTGLRHATQCRGNPQCHSPMAACCSLAPHLALQSPTV